MESMRPFKANALNLSHLPTWMLIIGLPLYWLEMAFHQNNHGITTPLAWIAGSYVPLNAPPPGAVHVPPAWAPVSSPNKAVGAPTSQIVTLPQCAS